MKKGFHTTVAAPDEWTFDNTDSMYQYNPDSLFIDLKLYRDLAHVSVQVTVKGMDKNIKEGHCNISTFLR